MAKVWVGGKIEVKLSGNKVNYSAGEVISGRIVLSQAQEFNGSELVIGLHGSEQTFFNMPGSEELILFSGKFSFLNAEQCLHSFKDQKSPVGIQEFQFQLRTPDWLPPSAIFSSDFQASNIKYRYNIYAQVIPTDKKLYIDPNKKVSAFRGAQEIYLYQPIRKVPICDNLKSRIEIKIGGLMGLGGKPSITDVIFDKNQYYTGEKVNVKIVCDNSQCSTGVKSFKIKLKRKVYIRATRLTGFNEQQTELLKTSKYLYQFKDTQHGCGPRQKVERNLSFDIPTVDPDLPDEALAIKYNDNDLPLVKHLTGSINGKLMTVLYSVKVFVKHDSVMQRGEGSCVTLPIKIMEIPQKIILKQQQNIGVEDEEETKEQLDLEKVPVAVNQTALEYYNCYVKNWQDSWLKAAPPTVMSEHEQQEEENEINASIANFENSKKQKVAKSNRFDKETQEIQSDPIPGITFVQQSDNSWLIDIIGPKSSVYEGGVFQMWVVFGTDYPFSAPVIRFKTKIYHPQVSQSGSLKVPIQMCWVPTNTAKQVLQQVVEAMTNISSDNHKQPGIAFEFVNNNLQFVQTAKQWTAQFAMTIPKTTDLITPVENTELN